MAGLPKRYAKMGFKKGWKAFKSKSKSTVKKVQTMARFKRKASRRFGGHRKHSRSSGSTNELTGIVLPAFAYGAVRPKLQSMTSGLTSMLPFGNNNDEIVYGVLGYFMAKKGSGMVRNAGRAILAVEAANLGNNIVSPMIGGSTSSTTGASSNANSGGWV